MVKDITNSYINIKEIQNFVDLCSTQHELQYHLQKYRETLQERVKELELITQKAQRVVQLKHIFKKGQKKLWLLLKDDEIKQINNMLKSKHIQI